MPPSTGPAASDRTPGPSSGDPGPRPDEVVSADPHWFDAAALDGLLGVGSLHLAPVAAPVSSPRETVAAFPGRDGNSTASPLLAALSVLILVGVAGVVVHRCWWDRRPGRYWPA